MPPATTAEEAFANLLKAQGMAANARESRMAQIFGKYLPAEHPLSQAYSGVYGVTPQADTAEALAQQLAFWRGRFPNTVDALSRLEQADPQALAHFRVMGGPEWAFGIHPGMSLGELERTARMNQEAGFLAGSPAQGAFKSTVTHELGHAIDTSLERKLLPGFKYGNKTAAEEAAAVKLNSLRAQLVEDALNGRISGYAKNSAIGALPETFRPGISMVTDPRWARLSAMDLKSELHPYGIAAAAREPFAEAFAKNPAMLSDVELAARNAGWRGAAQVGTMGEGALMLGAPLIGEAVANRFSGRTADLIRGASRGAGLGAMFGPEGALVGAAGGALVSQVPGINKLASQLF